MFFEKCQRVVPKWDNFWHSQVTLFSIYFRHKTLDPFPICCDVIDGRPLYYVISWGQTFVICFCWWRRWQLYDPELMTSVNNQLIWISVLLQGSSKNSWQIVDLRLTESNYVTDSLVIFLDYVRENMWLTTLNLFFRSNFFEFFPRLPSFLPIVKTANIIYQECKNED